VLRSPSSQGCLSKTGSHFTRRDVVEIAQRAADLPPVPGRRESSQPCTAGGAGGLCRQSPVGAGVFAALGFSRRTYNSRLRSAPAAARGRTLGPAYGSFELKAREMTLKSVNRRTGSAVLRPRSSIDECRTAAARRRSYSIERQVAASTQLARSLFSAEHTDPAHAPSLRLTARVVSELKTPS
jgi:hypothetical protein